jgi:hypothetical protein
MRRLADWIDDHEPDVWIGGALGFAVVVAVTFSLAGCGTTTRTVTVHRATRAGELHQPGAPVVRPAVHAVPVPAGSGSEARGDGRVVAGGASCGRERWSVKTATDPAAGNIKLAPVDTTVAALDALPTTNPGNPDQPRDGGVESTVYRVTATLVGAKREADSDFHLILREGSATMIAEIPMAPACTQPPVTEQVSVLEQQIESTRAAFIQEFGEPGSSGFTTIEHQVTVTGVGFFDVLHGQTGVAPNAIELHPALSIADP